MATSPAPNGTNISQYKDDASFSHFRKTVSLREWWLVKDDNGFEGKRLAVAGFTCGEQQAVRVFHSAPIIKTFDLFTLQTTDGIIVVLQGFINKNRTIENGFPSEHFQAGNIGGPKDASDWCSLVFNHFLFGFPPYWDIFAENCLKQAANAAIDFENTFDLDELTIDSDVTVIDVGPNSSPRRNKNIGESGHSIRGKKDCCHAVSKKFTADASNVSNLNNDAAGFSGAVLEKSNIASHSATPRDMLEGMMEISMSQNESHDLHPCFSASPLENHVDNKENDASENLPLSSCDLTNAVMLMEESIAVEAAASSEETLLSKGACMDAHGDSNFNLVAKDLALTVPNKPKSSKNLENQNERNKYGMKSRSTNFSAATHPLDHETLKGSIDEEKLTYKESLFRFVAVGDSCDLKQSSNQFDCTVMSVAKQTGEKVDQITPSKVKRGSINATAYESGRQKCSKPLENLKDNQEQKVVSGCPVKYKNKQSVLEVVEHLNKSKLKNCSSSMLQAEFNIQWTMLKAARELRNSSRSLKSKEKNEKVFVRGGSSTTKARRKSIFDTSVKNPRTQKVEEKTCIKSPESLNLKRSRSGRLLLPTLEFWRNQIPVYDADRNVTGIQEELRSSGGSKYEPQKKQKRKR